MSAQDKDVAEQPVQGTPTEEKTPAFPKLDGVVDLEKTDEAKKKAEVLPEEQKKRFPKLFVKKDELESVEVLVIFDVETGEVINITRPGVLNEALLIGLGVAHYTFKFKPVTYNEAVVYKRASSFYDKDSKELVLNRFQLRSFLLINHLKATDLVTEDGQPFRLEVDKESNNLSTDTLTRLYDAVPLLMEVVMSLFERRVLPNL